MQLPYPLFFPAFVRGLLLSMDEDDKPHGLFDLFSHDDDAQSSTEDEINRETQELRATDPVFQDARIEDLLFTLSDPQESISPSSTEDEVDGETQEATVQWAESDPSQESTLDYWRRQARLALWGIATLGTGGLTKDAVTGEIHWQKNATRIGDRMSEIAQQVPLGPMRGGGPLRPTGPAAVRTQPQVGPSFLFEAPQARPSQSHDYAVGTGRPSKKQCDEQEREEMAMCHEDYGQIFGYKHWTWHGCKERTKERALLCRKGRTDGPPRWSDADVDGIRWPKPPTSSK